MIRIFLGRGSVNKYFAIVVVALINAAVVPVVNPTTPQGVHVNLSSPSVHTRNVSVALDFADIINRLKLLTFDPHVTSRVSFVPVIVVA
jgi:hypothetical protein